MASNLAAAPASLDVGTLFVIATCVTSLLGLFLLFAWLQERIAALAWWGVAYLIGGVFRRALAVRRPRCRRRCRRSIANIPLVRRRRHDLERRAPVPRPAGPLGRHVLRRRVLADRMLLSRRLPHSAASRIIVSSLIVASYTFLIAAELWRERRKSLIRRWPAHVRADAARRHLPVSGGAGELSAVDDSLDRTRMDRGVCDRDSCSMSSAPPSSC